MTTMPNILEALSPREPFLISAEGGANDTDFGPTLTPAERVANEHYENIEVHLDSAAETYWCYMNPPGRPSFTPALLHDITQMQHSIKHLFDTSERSPCKYFVFASKAPGVYNLGGDLGYFVEHIRKGDRAAMSRYAHCTVDAVYRNSIAFGTPMMTIALIQGDALGGGFECALSLNLIVAEKSAKIGLPEILFNLFPGMGAYSFLSRRLDVVRAEKLITSGRIYSAEELHEMGVVDVLAEDGQGESAVREYIASHRRKWNAHYAIMQARQRVRPVTLDELNGVVDIWVEAALNLSDADLRKMERLVASQDRRMATVRNVPERVVA